MLEYRRTGQKPQHTFQNENPQHGVISSWKVEESASVKSRTRPRNATELVQEDTYRLDLLDLLFQVPILRLILDILRTSGNTHYAALLLLAFILGRRRRVVSNIRSRVRRARGRRTGQHGGDEERRGRRSASHVWD